MDSKITIGESINEVFNDYFNLSEEELSKLREKIDKKSQEK